MGHHHLRLMNEMQVHSYTWIFRSFFFTFPFLNDLFMWRGRELDKYLYFVRWCDQPCGYMCSGDVRERRSVSSERSQAKQAHEYR